MRKGFLIYSFLLIVLISVFGGCKKDKDVDTMHPNNGVSESISFSPDTTDIHILEGTTYFLTVNYYAYKGIKSIAVYKIEDGATHLFIGKNTNGFDSETNEKEEYAFVAQLEGDSVVTYRFEMEDKMGRISSKILILHVFQDENDKNHYLKFKNLVQSVRFMPHTDYGHYNLAESKYVDSVNIEDVDLLDNTGTDPWIKKWIPGPGRELRKVVEKDLGRLSVETLEALYKNISPINESDVLEVGDKYLLSYKGKHYLIEITYVGDKGSENWMTFVYFNYYKY
ncbi:MAG: hypothetical protein J7604_24430 [Sporocytophaga sp.]|uniref:hypothetical protein n=1 Tax=Sporocytophaga sp. TaxID=2231183 RepID=UPI001B0BA423|nr:hypothetical protein [Sporocytophaga sp.]MBO9703378.1 hypothetical protein [Sporocytophaga sp.]